MEATVEADFASYVRARQEHLLRVAVLMCGNVHTAEDLLQEALVKLAKQWSKVSTGYPDAYVRRILYNDNITRWRKVRFEVVSETLPEVAGIDLGDGWITHADVRRALQQLPPRQRAVLVLRYFEDLTEKQTAEVMGIALGSVKSQHFAALARMRELMGQGWGTTGGRAGEGAGGSTGGRTEQAGRGAGTDEGAGR